METTFLTPTEKELLIRGVEQDLQQLDIDLQSLYQRKSELETLLKKLKKNSESDTAKTKDTFLKKHDLTWKRICLDSLKTVDTFQTTADVYDFLIELYPEVKEADKSKTVASISWSLSQLSDRGEVVRIEKKFAKGNIWGLFEWFDRNTGEPLEKYKSALLKKGVPDFKYKPSKS